MKRPTCAEGDRLRQAPDGERDRLCRPCWRRCFCEVLEVDCNGVKPNRRLANIGCSAGDGVTGELSDSELTNLLSGGSCAHFSADADVPEILQLGYVHALAVVKDCDEWSLTIEVYKY